MKRLCFALALLVGLVGLSNPASADPKGGLFFGAFNCQVTLDTFPVPVGAHLNSTNCVGGNTGVGVVGLPVLSKATSPLGVGVGTDLTLPPAKGGDGVTVYNILYSEPCPIPSPPAPPYTPPIGLAMADALISADEIVVSPPPYTIHTMLAYVRVGVVAVVVLLNPHVHNFAVAKGHKGGKGGGIGLAVGVFVPKGPIPQCGGVAGMLTVDFVGVAGGVINFV